MRVKTLFLILCLFCSCGRPSTTSAAINFGDVPATTVEPSSIWEASLGNPGTNGFVLSSTTAGVRSWIAPGGGGVTPAALTGVNDTNVTLTLGGTPSTALLQATSLTLGWTGTLAAGRLNANVVQGITNDTNVTGSIAAQNLTLGWTGTLAIGRGGTGASTAPTALSALGGEPALGNPSTNGSVLSSTTSGTRSWIARINPRVDTSIGPGSATWSPNSDTTDIFELSGPLTTAVTTINNPTGTPVEGQKLMFRIKSDASPHALTWTGTQWRASTASGAPALPVTTTASKNLVIGFMWNSTDSKWDLLAVQDGF